MTAIGSNALGFGSGGSYNTAVGWRSQFNGGAAFGNTSVGVQSLSTNTAGGYNTAVGYGALFSSTVDNNTAVGFNSLYANTTGTQNTAIGILSLTANTTGARNTALGVGTLNVNTTGNYNTAAGFFALVANVTGSSNVALGYFAGGYETGSNAFYVDNQDRGSTAGDKVGALLYGVFNATPSLQTLKVNASLTVAYNVTAGAVNAFFGVKANSNQQACFGTTDAGSMQLMVGNSTNVSMDLQSIEQGSGVQALRLNPLGGAVQLASTGAATQALGSLTAAQGFGCNGSTARTSYASGGAAPAGGTGTTAGAYDTAAHRDALITLVNNIRTALVNNGIMS